MFLDWLRRVMGGKPSSAARVSPPSIAAAICTALVWLTPIGNFAGLLLYVGIYQSMFPSTVS